MPKILTYEYSRRRRALSLGDPATVSLDSFLLRWSHFSGGMFDGLDWSNIFVAGGAVLGLFPSFLSLLFL